jgi:hypothetical protein
MKPGLSAVLYLIFFFQIKTAEAQTVQEDSAFYQSAFDHSISFYFSQLGDQSPLYNGFVYAAYEYNFKTGTPYFPSIHFSPGSVVYDGINYDSLTLLYEDLRQQVVIKKESLLLQLVSERVSAFKISGHAFIRLVADTTNTGISRTGFYEILYPGPSRVLKETIKNITEQASIYEGILRSVSTDYEYFIQRGSDFHRIRSKSDLLKVFRDRQKDIQKFIKKNKLNYRYDTENTLISVAEFYDQVTK